MPAAQPTLLVLNAGSSSLKFALFAAHHSLRPLCRGRVEAIGGDVARCVVQGEDANGTPGRFADHEQALTWVLGLLARRRGDRLVAVGHRVVHGGLTFAAPTLLDERVYAALEALIPLAPLHQPHCLAGVAAMARLQPGLPQIACFDTAFHRTQPAVAQTLALPVELSAAGVRRYGFHGLSYEYIARVLSDVAGHLPARAIVAHLGNGASLCAMLDGRSVATTMGFTPLDGVPMGTRPGALDPGAVLYLFQGLGMSVTEVQDLLYHRCGLLGVSGISRDMRELLRSAAPQAQAAVDLFVYQVGRAIGSLAAALQGLDALVFTAGIGERAAVIRARIVEQMAWLGGRLDVEANAADRVCVSTSDSTVSLWVIPTDEELMIARHTLDVLRDAGLFTGETHGSEH